MTVETAGKGDPLNVLDLAWNGLPPPKRGRRAKFTLPDILAIAIRVADNEGLDAVTTRRVADDIGISPMSFYTYLPGKNELLDLMFEAIHAEFEPLKGRNWRSKLDHFARQMRALYRRHNWALQLRNHRPIFGPHVLTVYERALAAIDGLGIDEIEMDQIVTLITDYVTGSVRASAFEGDVWRKTGRTDDEWWYAVGPLLAKVIDSERFPVVSRVGPVTGAKHGLHDPDNTFEYGLARILDGLASRISR